MLVIFELISENRIVSIVVGVIAFCVFTIFGHLVSNIFHIILVTLEIISESFWCHFGVLGRPGAPKGPMVEEKRNQSDFGRHYDGIPP